MATTMKVGDVGTLISVDVGTDVSTNTSKKIRYQKPSGFIGEWNALLSGTQLLQYVTVADDIDEEGLWTFQAYVVLPSGEWYGELATQNRSQLQNT